MIPRSGMKIRKIRKIRMKRVKKDGLNETIHDIV